MFEKKKHTNESKITRIFLNANFILLFLFFIYTCHIELLLSSVQAINRNKQIYIINMNMDSVTW